MPGHTFFYTFPKVVLISESIMYRKRQFYFIADRISVYKRDMVSARGKYYRIRVERRFAAFFTHGSDSTFYHSAVYVLTAAVSHDNFVSVFKRVI